MRHYNIEEWLDMHAFKYLESFQHLTVFQYIDSCQSNLLPYILKECDLEDLMHKLNSRIINLR